MGIWGCGAVAGVVSVLRNLEIVGICQKLPEYVRNCRNLMDHVGT